MLQFPFLVDSFSDLLYINNILFCIRITAYSFYIHPSFLNYWFSEFPNFWNYTF